MDRSTSDLLAGYMLRSMAMGLVVTATLCGCASSSRQGDQASATGDWRSATEFYSAALRDSPNDAELQRKYQRARRDGIRAALDTARRCKLESDMACVERETSWILTIDSGNDQAARLRLEARSGIAKASIAAASEHAARGSYLEAVRSLVSARRAAAPEQEADIAAAGKAFAEPAVVYAQRLLTDAASSDLAERKAKCSDALEILREVAGHTAAGPDALAAAQAQLEELERLESQQRERQQQKEVKAQRQAVAAVVQSINDTKLVMADAQRTVSVLGAYVAPTKSSGDAWDFGIGGAQPTRDQRDAAKTLLTTALGAGNPSTAVARLLAGPALTGFAPPDPFGNAELFIDGQPAGQIEIAKTQDTFTPQWPGVVWTGVDIRAAHIRIVLSDKDVSKDDPVGEVEIGPEQLQAAARKGGVVPVPVNEQGTGQILFVRVSAM